MAEHLTLMEFIQRLLSDEQTRDWFAENPDAALRHFGLDNLSPEDVRDALVLIEDNQTASFDREYNTGWNGSGHSSGRDHDDRGGRDDHDGPDNDDRDGRDGRDHDDRDGHGGDDHRAAIETINRYVNNTYTDDRDTIVDNSTNQQIDTRGGNFDQAVGPDTVAVTAINTTDGKTVQIPIVNGRAHWVAAERQGQTAALAMLGVDDMRELNSMKRPSRETRSTFVASGATATRLVSSPSQT